MLLVFFQVAAPEEPPSPDMVKHFQQAPKIFQWMWIVSSMTTVLVAMVGASHASKLIRVAVEIRREKQQVFVPVLAGVYLKIFFFFPLIAVLTWSSLVIIRFALMFQLLLHLYEVGCLLWFWDLMADFMGGPEMAYQILQLASSLTPPAACHLALAAAQFPSPEEKIGSPSGTKHLLQDATEFTIGSPDNKTQSGPFFKDVHQSGPCLYHIDALSPMELNKNEGATKQSYSYDETLDSKGKMPQLSETASLPDMCSASLPPTRLFGNRKSGFETEVHKPSMFEPSVSNECLAKKPSQLRVLRMLPESTPGSPTSEEDIDDAVMSQRECPPMYDAQRFWGAPACSKKLLPPDIVFGLSTTQSPSQKQKRNADLAMRVPKSLTTQSWALGIEPTEGSTASTRIACNRYEEDTPVHGSPGHNESAEQRAWHETPRRGTSFNNNGSRGCTTGSSWSFRCARLRYSVRKTQEQVTIKRVPSRDHGLEATLAWSRYLRTVKFGPYRILGNLPLCCSSLRPTKRSFTKADLRLSYYLVAQYFVFALLSALARAIAHGLVLFFQILSLTSLYLAMFGLFILFRATRRIIPREECRLEWKFAAIKIAVFLIKGTELVLRHAPIVKGYNGSYGKVTMEQAWTSFLVNVCMVPLIILSSWAYSKEDITHRYSACHKTRTEMLISLLSSLCLESPGGTTTCRCAEADDLSASEDALPSKVDEMVARIRQSTPLHDTHSAYAQNGTTGGRDAFRSSFVKRVIPFRGSRGKR